MLVKKSEKLSAFLRIFEQQSFFREETFGSVDTKQRLLAKSVK